jgi:hypothetical protein
MSNLYGGGVTAPAIGITATVCTCCCNNSSICDPASICYNATLCNNPGLLGNLIDYTTGCIHLAVAQPSPMHMVGVLPVLAGGFMLTNTSVRMFRLWYMELIDFIARRKR